MAPRHKGGRINSETIQNAQICTAGHLNFETCKTTPCTQRGGIRYTAVKWRHEEALREIETVMTLGKKFKNEYDARKLLDRLKQKN